MIRVFVFLMVLLAPIVSFAETSEQTVLNSKHPMHANVVCEETTSLKRLHTYQKMDDRTLKQVLDLKEIQIKKLLKEFREKYSQGYEEKLIQEEKKYKLDGFPELGPQSRWEEIATRLFILRQLRLAKRAEASESLEESAK